MLNNARTRRKKVPYPFSMNALATMRAHRKEWGRKMRIFYSLSLSVRAKERYLFLEYIAADDDASLQSILKHATLTTKKGKFPNKVPEPAFLADLGQRTKTASKPIFVLVKL